MTAQMAAMDVEEQRDQAALGARPAAGGDVSPKPVIPAIAGADADGEEVFAVKPSDMGQGFYEELVSKKIPSSLVWHMAEENILALEDLPNYCLTKESIMDTLVNANVSTRGMRKLRPPLGKMWGLVKAQAELGGPGVSWRA